MHVPAAYVKLYTMPKPSVSIIIPAYNEEGQLALCLDAIARQTVKPLEVIVVDNNSTDGTVAVASRYPFVTVLHESKQGVFYARNSGFDAARGEIIGRLDGDSAIDPDWVERVQSIFADDTVEAVSGQISYRDVGLDWAFNNIDRRIRRYLSRRMGDLGEQFLYGVNMAIRRKSWQKVRGEVCSARHLHEDLDLAAHLSFRRSNVIFEPSLHVSISPRQAASGLRQFLHYTWSNQRVFTEHNMQSRRYIWRIALLVSCLYVPIHLLYRGYNPKTQRFSLVYALTNAAQARISPVSESM